MAFDLQSRWATVCSALGEIMSPLALAYRHFFWGAFGAFLIAFAVRSEVVFSAPVPDASESTPSSAPSPKPDTSKSPTKEDELRAKRENSFFRPAHEIDRPRSDILSPSLNFVVGLLVLPGMDQWIEGQYSSAVAYTGVGAAAQIYSLQVAKNNGLLDKKVDDSNDSDAKKTDSLDEKDNVQRKILLGGLISQGAAGLSTYHAFRTAVVTRQGRGEYQFLTEEERPVDLLKAPLHFEFLARETTYVPLLIDLGISALILSNPGTDMVRDSFTGEDAFFTATYSWNAGTHEEAIFRGWLMPVMMESWNSPFWSNVSQSVLFAAAHLGTNSTPIPQLLLGYHLGYVTQQNHWTLAESVFVHTWWDVIAFATTWQYRRVELKNTGKMTLPPPVFWFPPLQILL